jgi:hypothetical protein
MPARFHLWPCANAKWRANEFFFSSIFAVLKNILDTESSIAVGNTGFPSLHASSAAPRS